MASAARPPTTTVAKSSHKLNAWIPFNIATAVSMPRSNTSDGVSAGRPVASLPAFTRLFTMAGIQ